jgi:hypothetical protein
LGFGIIKGDPLDPLEGYLINQINPIPFLFHTILLKVE